MFRFIALTSNREIVINPLIGVDNTIIQLIDLNDNIKRKLMLKFSYWGVSCNNSDLFLLSCSRGHLEVAKWLIETFDDINVHVYSGKAFRLSCENGHLEVAKWLLETFGDIDVHAKNDYAFIWSCYYGYLEVTKWLITITPNIRQNNDNYLKISNNYKRYNLVELICDQSPYYKCEYKDGKPIGYSIKEYINVKG